MTTRVILTSPTFRIVFRAHQFLLVVGGMQLVENDMKACSSSKPGPAVGDRTGARLGSSELEGLLRSTQSSFWPKRIDSIEHVVECGFERKGVTLQLR